MQAPSWLLPALRATRLDGFYSLATSIGDALSDKGAQHAYQSRAFNDWYLQALYEEEPLSRKICRKYPENALSRGVAPKLSDDDGGVDRASALVDELDKLDGISKVIDCASLERAMGGALLLLITDDGDDLFEPLGEYGRVTSLLEFSTTEAAVMEYGTDHRDTETFGRPVMYWLAMPDGSARRVHHSRVIAFPGGHVSKYTRMRRRGWGQSLLHNCMDAISTDSVVWSGAATAMQDKGFGVMKMYRLPDLLETDEGREAVEARANAVAMMRAVGRMILVGHEEDYDHGDLDFGNYPEMLDRMMHRLAAVSGYPVTELYGRSAGGQNATGEGDRESYYADVRAYRTLRLVKPITKLLRAISAGSEVEGDGELTSLSLGFPEFEEQSDKERAEYRKLVGETDKLYFDMQSITAEEVAINRFRKEGFSDETVIDLDAREQMLALELEHALEEAKKTPEERAAEEAERMKAMQPDNENPPNQGGKEAPDGNNAQEE